MASGDLAQCANAQTAGRIGSVMEALKDFAGYFLALLVGIIAWFGRRDLDKYDKGLDRVATLERNTVTRDEMSEALDRRDIVQTKMHDENKRDLTEILKTIRANEERDSKTRHTIRDEVQFLGLQIALMAQAQGIDLPRRMERDHLD